MTDTPENHSPDKSIATEAVSPYTITHQGSLGLLALGAKGLKAWREQRAEFLRQNPPTPPDETNS